MRRLALFSLVLTTSIIALGVGPWLAKWVRVKGQPAVDNIPAKTRGYTVAQRLEQYGDVVAGRLTPAFSAANVDYPPYEMAYVAFKDERQLLVYARNAASEQWRFIKQYRVHAASGVPGPKLAEGDRQVPEGIYQAQFLNANSRFHLSIRLDYPNDFDRKMAFHDTRSGLGGDIMIHGNAVSIGCLAMGDEGAEDLFILAAQVSRDRLRIVVSPTDFRVRNAAPPPHAPTWTGTLYATLRRELKQYPQPIATLRR